MILKAKLNMFTKEREILLQRIEQILDENTQYKTIISNNLLPASAIENNKVFQKFI